MRDIHGRYTDIKDIQSNGPTWAHGCDGCQGGLVGAPALTGVDSIYMERLAQVLLHQLSFCTCQAGIKSEQYYRKVWKRLVAEAKGHPMMKESAARKSHPDIEAAMNAVVMAQPAPAIHKETKHAQQVAEFA